MVAPDFGEHLINRKSLSPRPFTNTFEPSDLPFFRPENPASHPECNGRCLQQMLVADWV